MPWVSVLSDSSYISMDSACVNVVELHCTRYITQRVSMVSSQYETVKINGIQLIIFFSAMMSWLALCVSNAQKQLLGHYRCAKMEEEQAVIAGESIPFPL